MKKLLRMMTIVTLVGTSIGSFPSVNNTRINQSDTFDVKQKLIRSPKDTLLTTAGDWMTPREEWCYTTINLGDLRQEQIVDITSTNKNSYTEHKVVGYDYHKKDYNAGINRSSFREYFHQGQVLEGSWSYQTAVDGAANNFKSSVMWGLGIHNASGYVKFHWYYDINNDLLVDVIAALSVSAYLSTEEGVASVKIGTVFTIKYME